ncbi:MAG: serine hydrolase, partial [Sciscionella sp.]
MNYPHGTVGAGFAPVRDEFSEILARTRGGAAFSVVRRGETLVDLWGGMADRRAGAPWHEDTVVVLF